MPCIPNVVAHILNDNVDIWVETCPTTIYIHLIMNKGGGEGGGRMASGYRD